MADLWNWFDTLPGDVQEQWVTMHKIVEAVATKYVLSYEGDAGDWIGCPFCHGEDDWRNPEHPIDGHFIHEPTCPVVKARELLASETKE